MANDKKKPRNLGSYFDERAQDMRRTLERARDVAAQVEALGAALRERGYREGNLEVCFVTQDGKKDGVPEASPVRFDIFMRALEHPSYRVSTFQGAPEEYRLYYWNYDEALDGLNHVATYEDPSIMLETLEKSLLLDHSDACEHAARVAKVKGGKLELK